MEKEIEQIPSYKEITREVLSKLNDRKGLVLKRTLLASWPGLFIILLISILENFSFSERISGIILVISIALVPLAFLYMLIFYHMFSMEKILWIDSNFDGYNLLPKESFGIAKKIFWPSLLMRLQIFMRYHLVPLVIFFILLFISLYLPISLNVRYSPWIFVLMFIVILPIMIYLYYYYIKIKLRYIWFIFFDNFSKTNLCYSDLFKEMSELNKINKKESFKKSLISNFGIDLTHDITRFTTGISIHSTLGNMGNVGKVTADVAGAYASESIYQFSSLAKIVTNYLLYCVAMREFHGKERKINAEIYSLK